MLPATPEASPGSLSLENTFFVSVHAQVSSNRATSDEEIALVLEQLWSMKKLPATLRRVCLVGRITKFSITTKQRVHGKHSLELKDESYVRLVKLILGIWPRVETTPRASGPFMEENRYKAFKTA